MVLILISACSLNEVTLTSEKNTLTAEEEKLYHQYFDLSDIQKDELRARGYSEKVIANMDRVDFEEAEKTWIISKEQVFYIKNTHSELQNIDISKWTNADVQAYRDTILEKQRLASAPSPEQLAELEKRGITLEIAHQMLRDYIDYDTLLSQPDKVLNDLKECILKDQKEGQDYILKMNEIRAKYKERKK